MIHRFSFNDDRLSVVFSELGGVIHAERDELLLRRQSHPQGMEHVAAADVEELLLFGSIAVTPAALALCADAGVRLHYFQRDGWYHGMRTGQDTGSLLSIGDFESSEGDDRSSDSVARSLIGARLSLQAQVLLMLGVRSGYVTDSAAAQLRALSADASAADSVEELRQLERRGATAYWAGFRRCLREQTGWKMRDRHERPYRDVANRVLGLTDGLLARDAVVALRRVGVPMAVGVYHRPDPERPALMMDLMEPFRPLVADVAAYDAIAASSDPEDDWLEVGGTATLTDAHRAHVFDTYERNIRAPERALGATTLREAIATAARDLPVLRRSYFSL